MAGRRIYSPAELLDLAHSPLVAAPANMVILSEEDLPGPTWADQRHERGPNNVSGYPGGNGARRVRGQGRRLDRRWAQGPEVGATHRNPRGHHEEHEAEGVAWLDPTENDDSGFGGFSESVAEFEQWKQAQRGDPVHTQADIDEPSKDIEEKPEEKAQVANGSDDQKELWESKLNLATDTGSSSRFSTFFTPTQQAQQAQQAQLAQLAQQSQPNQQLFSHGHQAAQVSQGQHSTPQSTQSHQSQQALGRTAQPAHQNQQQNQQQQQAQQQAQQFYQRQYNAPPGMLPPGLARPGMYPPGMSPYGSAPPGMIPPGMVPQGMAPPGMFGLAPPGMQRGPPPGLEQRRNDEFFNGLLKK